MRFVVSLAAALLLIGAGTIGTASGSVPGPSPSPSSPPPGPYLVLSPDPGTILVAATQPYSVASFNGDGTSNGALTGLQLDSLSVAPDGTCDQPTMTCSATVAGDHTVTAAYTNTSTGLTATGSALLHVVDTLPTPTPTPTQSAPPSLDHLVLAPDPSTTGVSGSQAYTAEGFGANGFDLGDVTGVTAFVITLTATGLPDGTCSAGTCSGPFVTGDHTVTGTDGVGVHGTATLHVALAPGPVSDVSAAPGDGQASVSWSAPASDGGSPITGYSVTTPGGQSASVDGSTTTATVVGLADGTPYAFTVTAANLAGTSTPVTSAAVTPLPNTPAGTGGSVSVVPINPTGATSPATTTFSDVTGTGTTSVTVIDTSAPSAPPPPAMGYAVSGSPVYYDIQTTATYSGSVTVCLSYAGIVPAPTDLLHYSGSPTPTWVPLVVTSNDSAAQVICGTTTSLSPFALATWRSPIINVPSGVSATATGATGVAATYAVTAADSAGTALAPVCTPLSGAMFPIGATTVTCTATDGRLRISSASFIVVVERRATSLSTTCVPNPVLPGSSSTCTAVVADTMPSPDVTPSGTVTWGIVAGVGTFGPTSCSSSASDLRCTVSYTVAASQRMRQTVLASYGGDPTYTGSSGSTGLDLLVAGADRYVTTVGAKLVVAGPGVLANDLPVGLAALLASKPAKGTLTLAATGGFTYVPAAGFTGSATFTYQAMAGSLASSPATVTLDVVGPGMSCMAGCDLSGFTLAGDNLSGGNFTGASLAGAAAGGVNLNGANLSGANLAGADLTRALLGGANLSKASLARAVLKGANLNGANLTGADLTGANLQGATLSGANLKGVTWSATTCPDGTGSTADGGACTMHLQP